MTAFNNEAPYPVTFRTSVECSVCGKTADADPVCVYPDQSFAVRYPLPSEWKLCGGRWPICSDHKVFEVLVVDGKEMTGDFDLKFCRFILKPKEAPTSNVGHEPPPSHGLEEIEGGAVRCVHGCRLGECDSCVQDPL